MAALQTVELDGTAIKSLRGFHAAFARLPGVPDYYGRNLDALDEVLADLPVNLIWRRSETSRSAMKGDFVRLIEVLDHAASANSSPFSFELR